MPHHDGNGLSSFAARMRRGAVKARTQKSESPRPNGAAAAGVGDPARRPLTTAEATIRREDRPGYARLVWGEGERHLVRTELGSAGAAGRADRRRSILYFAHHTDTHVCDAQSPSRLEPGERFTWFNPGADGGHRPQETCTAQVLDQMVRATNAVATSPLTGAAMACCVQTGDNTDNRTTAETRWFVDVLNGRPVTPDTGAPGRYEGLQRSHAKWAFQADDPSGTAHGRAGFPALPGFLDAALRRFEPAGLTMEWLAVMGNHDAVFLGTFGPMPGLRFDRYGDMLVGAGRKPTSIRGMIAALGHATFVGVEPAGWDRRRSTAATVAVTPDAEARRPLDLDQYLAALLEDGSTIGGPGHGFTDQNRREGTAWWSRPAGDEVQLIGLDTCNHTRGSEGVMADAEFRWLESELQRHSSRWLDAHGSWCEGDADDRLCVLFSHHNSWTMTNKGADDRFGGPRHQGPEVVDLLHRFPNVILWVNGHSHEHRIVAHPTPTLTPTPSRPECGFWEVNTASCIDFGQQARTLELLDNADGTLSIFTTVLDHAAPASIPVPAVGEWTPERLASMSRELSANDGFWFDPFDLLGHPKDRNTELLITDPRSVSGTGRRPGCR